MRGGGTYGYEDFRFAMFELYTVSGPDKENCVPPRWSSRAKGRAGYPMGSFIREWPPGRVQKESNIQAMYDLPVNRNRPPTNSLSYSTLWSIKY